MSAHSAEGRARGEGRVSGEEAHQDEQRERTTTAMKDDDGGEAAYYIWGRATVMPSSRVLPSGGADELRVRLRE